MINIHTEQKREQTPVLKFIVYGDPKAQKRHRHWHRNGISGTYDPSQADKKDFIAQIIDKRPSEPFNCPLSLDLEFYFQRPKSHYGTGKNAKKLKATAPEYHTSRPDLDNLEKFVKDAGNGILWRDDCLICSVNKIKLYSSIPRTEIVIRKL